MKNFLTFFLLLLNIATFAQSGAIDTTFNTSNNGIYGNGSGFNGDVRSTNIQLDGKVLMGGLFTSFNSIARNCIARLNIDGSLDTTFNPGTGFNLWVYSTSIQSDGKIIVGGIFTSFNGAAINRIARLNIDGSLDTTFNPGTGFDDEVWSMSIQSDGKIIVAGAFTSFNGISKNYIARLNVDGSLDTSFNPGTGFNNVVASVHIQSDGNIIVGGRFTLYNGTARNRIVRLNTGGSLDTTFNPGTGFDGSVWSISIQTDGNVILGGEFTQFNGLWRNHIVRLFNCIALSSQTQSACSSYTLNGQTYTNSGTYIQNLTNSAGCNFTLTLNLTISQPTADTLNETTCSSSYTLNGQTYTSSGTYIQNLSNAAGCDSTVTLNLIINSVDTSLLVSGSTLTAIETGASYQWLDCNNAYQPIVGAVNQSFTAQQSGNYAVQITKNGCAQISNCYQVQGTSCAGFSINFTLTQSVPFEVSIQPYINGSQPSNNISLNWDFGDGSPLLAQNPATSLSHLYAGNGPYVLCMYVFDSTLNCSGALCDTLEIDSLGVLLRGSVGLSIGIQPVIFNGVVAVDNISGTDEMNISLYPNPAKNQATVAIELGTVSDIRIRLINSLGQTIQSAKYSDVMDIRHNLNLSELPAAIYMVEISANGISKTQKLIRSQN